MKVLTSSISLLVSIICYGQLFETPINESIHFPSQGTINIDLNEDGIDDLRFETTYSESFPQLVLKSIGADALIAGQVQDGHYCLPMSDFCDVVGVAAVEEVSSEVIGDEWDWVNRSFSDQGELDHTTVPWDGSNFVSNGTHQYVGVRFTKEGETHYGIIKALYGSDGNFLVESWTYNSDPGGSIAVEQDLITGNSYEKEEKARDGDDVLVINSVSDAVVLLELGYRWFNVSGIEFDPVTQALQGYYFLRKEDQPLLKVLVQ